MPVQYTTFTDVRMGFAPDASTMPGAVTPYAAIRARLDVGCLPGGDVKTVMLSMSGEDNGEGSAYESYFSVSSEGENIGGYYLELLRVYDWLDHAGMKLLDHPPDVVNEGGQVSTSTTWGWQVGASGGVGFFGPIPTGHFDVQGDVNHSWTVGGSAQLTNFGLEDNSSETNSSHAYSLKLLADGSRYAGRVADVSQLPALSQSDFKLVELPSWQTVNPDDNGGYTLNVQLTAVIGQVGSATKHRLQGHIQILIDLSQVNGVLPSRKA